MCASACACACAYACAWDIMQVDRHRMFIDSLPKKTMENKTESLQTSYVYKRKQNKNKTVSL